MNAFRHTKHMIDAGLLSKELDDLNKDSGIGEVILTLLRENEDEDDDGPTLVFD
jgi:hypothetical protein